MDLDILEEIGLTKSEIKVYEALLMLGSSKVGPIIEESKVASSKIYELLHKLSNKGLITDFSENKVKYFKAINPKFLLDYVNSKKEDLISKENKLKKLMPQLEQIYNEKKQKLEVEVFKGFKGVYNAFMGMINALDSGDEFLTIGGGDSPSTNPRTKTFFENIHRKRSEKGIKFRIIFSESRRKTQKKLSLFPHTYPKYLPYGTPSTINIYKDTTFLLSMSPTPALIRIKDANITESYRIYFEKMWKIAKK